MIHRLFAIMLLAQAACLPPKSQGRSVVPGFMCEFIPEEILFETPELCITTERLIFYNATFEVSYVASMDVDERTKEWSLGVFFLAFVMFVFIGSRFIGAPDGIVAALVMALIAFLLHRLPKEHVLTITMKDKMFYEVITRTREESEIIQRYVDEAIDIFRNYEKAAKRNKTDGFSSDKWQSPD